MQDPRNAALPGSPDAASSAQPAGTGLSVDLGGLRMANPVTVASGTFG